MITLEGRSIYRFVYLLTASTGGTSTLRMATLPPHIQQSRHRMDLKHDVFTVREVHQALNNARCCVLKAPQGSELEPLGDWQWTAGKYRQSVWFSIISCFPAVSWVFFSDAVIISTESLICSLIKPTKRSVKFPCIIPIQASRMFVELIRFFIRTSSHIGWLLFGFPLR